jgi:hypothetical protein
LVLFLSIEHFGQWHPGKGFGLDEIERFDISIGDNLFDNRNSREIVIFLGNIIIIYYFRRF